MRHKSYATNSMTKHFSSHRINEYGIIAEASLYLLPAMIVQAFAFAQKREFWSVWHSMGLKGYSEVKNMKVF